MRLLHSCRQSAGLFILQTVLPRYGDLTGWQLGNRLLLVAIALALGVELGALSIKAQCQARMAAAIRAYHLGAEVQMRYHDQRVRQEVQQAFLSK